MKTVSGVQQFPIKVFFLPIRLASQVKLMFMQPPCTGGPRRNTYNQSPPSRGSRARTTGSSPCARKLHLSSALVTKVKSPHHIGYATLRHKRDKVSIVPQPSVAQVWPSRRQVSPRSPQILVRDRTKLGRPGPECANLDPSSTDAGQKSSEFGRFRPEVDELWPHVTHTWPNSDKSALESVKLMVGLLAAHYAGCTGVDTGTQGAIEALRAAISTSTGARHRALRGVRTMAPGGNSGVWPGGAKRCGVGAKSGCSTGIARLGPGQGAPLCQRAERLTPKS